jgi:hypothetical protein
VRAIGSDKKTGDSAHFYVDDLLRFRNRPFEFSKASARVRLIITTWSETLGAGWRREW